MSCHHQSPLGSRIGLEGEAEGGAEGEEEVSEGGGGAGGEGEEEFGLHLLQRTPSPEVATPTAPAPGATAATEPPGGAGESRAEYHMNQRCSLSPT